MKTIIKIILSLLFCAIFSKSSAQCLATEAQFVYNFSDKTIKYNGCEYIRPRTFHRDTIIRVKVEGLNRYLYDVAIGQKGSKLVFQDGGQLLNGLNTAITGLGGITTLLSSISNLVAPTSSTPEEPQKVEEVADVALNIQPMPKNLAWVAAPQFNPIKHLSMSDLSKSNAIAEFLEPTGHALHDKQVTAAKNIEAKCDEALRLANQRLDTYNRDRIEFVAHYTAAQEKYIRVFSLYTEARESLKKLKKEYDELKIKKSEVDKKLKATEGKLKRLETLVEANESLQKKKARRIIDLRNFITTSHTRIKNEITSLLQIEPVPYINVSSGDIEKIIDSLITLDTVLATYVALHVPTTTTDSIVMKNIVAAQQKININKIQNSFQELKILVENNKQFSYSEFVSSPIILTQDRHDLAIVIKPRSHDSLGFLYLPLSHDSISFTIFTKENIAIIPSSGITLSGIQNNRFFQQKESEDVFRTAGYDDSNISLGIAAKLSVIHFSDQSFQKNFGWGGHFGLGAIYSDGVSPQIMLGPSIVVAGRQNRILIDLSWSLNFVRRLNQSGPSTSSLEQDLRYDLKARSALTFGLSYQILN